MKQNLAKLPIQHEVRKQAKSKPICCAAERLVPYLQLLVVPLLGRMSDAQPAVRRLAAPAFAVIVALMPLAQVRLFLTSAVHIRQESAGSQANASCCNPIELIRKYTMLL